MKTTTKRAQRRSEKALRQALATIFAAAHREGRAVMSEEEFLLTASIVGLRDSEVNRALLLDLVRKGVTGYWMREAPDPGAQLVFARAMRAVEFSDEADTQELPAFTGSIKDIAAEWLQRLE